jgi:integrase
MRDQIRESRLVWERDRRNGLPGVYLPRTLESKYPNAGTEWPWQWVWPSCQTSVDPRSNIRRRHHIHETAFQKAVKAAGIAAGLSKRVHPHLFRHSFATAFLMQGGAIHELQSLLGHASLETTKVYLHCIGPATGRMRSPLDAQPSNIVQMNPMPGLRAAELIQIQK